jgi:acetylornithine deacetylase
MPGCDRVYLPEHRIPMFDIDRAFTFQTLGDLVRINSINPAIAPGGAGEAEIAAYFGRAFDSLGLEAELIESQAGRVSAVGIWRGSGGGRSLMINGHIDTVGIEGMPAPFSAQIREGRLYGRGAHDMKGSLAGALGAVKALKDAGAQLRGDLLIAAVCDEEYGSMGTEDLLLRHRTDAAIVAEPTNLSICLAHKGFTWLEVDTFGKAAHGSRFGEGVDAIMRMGRFLHQLESLEQRLRNGPAHPLVGPPSLHASMIQGGSGLSTYSARCRLNIERRTVPGENADLALQQLQDILNCLQSSDPGFNASARIGFSRDPFEVPLEAAIVRSVARASELVMGKRPDYVGDTPWMDAALLSAAGIETVIIGPTGKGQHSDEEWVDLQSVLDFADILATTIQDYCV